MQTRRTRGLAAALLVSALFTSACGLKPEVKDQLSQGGSAGGAGAAAGAVGGGGGGGGESGVGGDTALGEVPADGTVPGADTGVTDPATAGEQVTTDTGTGGGGDAGTGEAAAPGAPAAGGGSTGGGTGGGSTGGGSTGGGDSGDSAPAPGAPAPGGGAGPAPANVKLGPDSKTGVDDKKKTIKIALHGPLTGAGVPQNSFISGTPKYWKGKKVKGYSVIAEAFDDKYQPGPAVKACNQQAKENFLLLGGAGTDQIQACARSQVLRRGNVPYLSAGVTTNGLNELGNYFATSLTYAQQADLVVKMARKGNYLNSKNGWGVVISNTPNFADAEKAIVKALKASGQKTTVVRTPKSGGDSTAVANQLREGQFGSVYFLGQPTFFIELVGKAGCPAYCPQWAGVGVSMGTNSIGSLACRGSGNQYKGEFLSPIPALDQAARLAPGVRFQDDIEFGIYGTMQLLDKMLQSVPGDSFTREGFIASIEGKTFSGPITGTTTFAKGRFGGTAAYALRMNCGKGQHETNGQYT